MRLLIVSIVLTFILGSCSDDFLEKSVGKAKIVVLSPSNNKVSSSSSVTFWWEEVEGATGYELQVVRPDFSNVQQLLLDTTVTGNKFTYTFQPGNQYQWRVRAVNNSSKSEYFQFSFGVDSTLDLSKQIIQLISPTANYATNKTKLLFKWGKISFADDYRFELLSPMGSIIDVKAAILYDTVSYKFSTEGAYTWRVQGHSNNGSSTAYSVGSFTIDWTAPEVSVPTLPVDNDTSSFPATLTWARDASAYKDSLLIATDTTFKNVVYSAFTENTTYQLAPKLVAAKYFWKLKTVDAAGNWSGYSKTYRIRKN